MAYVPNIPVQNGISTMPGSTAGGNTNLDTIMKILNSPGGAALIGAAGAGISAYGQNKNQEANMQQNAQQFAASMAQRQLENDQQRQLAQAQSAAAASPLGAEQGFAQRQALLSAILPGLRNSNITPGDPAVAAAMGNIQGGLRLPEGGLDPAMIERLFGDKATLASLQQRGSQIGQINPNGPITNLGAMFGQAGADVSNNINASNQGELQRQAQEEARQRQIIMSAIDDDIASQHPGKPPEGYEYDKKTGQLKKKGSVWKKVGKIALIGGAGLATALTAGAASPALAAAIGAGAGAGVGAIDGGWKGALTGAALGGVTGGIGGGAAGGIGGSVARTAASTGLKQAALNGIAKNPAMYSAILGR